MELRQLEYFAAVARHRHFGRAASEVYVTQSALSQQIARLEAELGVKLFERTAKGVALTPAGVELDDHARTILSDVAAARAAIDDHRGAMRGLARIAAAPPDSAAPPPARPSSPPPHHPPAPPAPPPPAPGRLKATRGGRGGSTRWCSGSTT